MNEGRSASMHLTSDRSEPMSRDEILEDVE
jgi:hypothetical protein